MERRNAEPGLVDGMTADLGGPRTAALLEKLEAAAPWDRLARPLHDLYKSADPEHAGGGRPFWGPTLMLKCLMLAKWFGLSDAQLEESLKDRLSFRRFAGLSLTDATPDETTFVVFRRRLREAGKDREIFGAVLRHIEKQGLLVKEGTLVDATIVEAPRGGKREDGTSTRDPEASYTSKHGRGYHGYKGHVAADQSGIVTGYTFSTAKHHDSRYIDGLTKGERKAVFADSAYSDGQRRARLRRRGVIDAICYKRNRGQAALEPWQERWNRLVAPYRARVEHAFARMKQMGYRRARYRGLRRNEFDFVMNLIGHNIKRSLHLRSLAT